jgi:hypothetical protein
VDARDDRRCWCRCSVVPRWRSPLSASRLTRGAASGDLVSRIIGVLDRAQLAYLFVAVRVALVVVRPFRDLTPLTARRQLGWIAWGAVLGVARSRSAMRCPGRSAQTRRLRCS